MKVMLAKTTKWLIFSFFLVVFLISILVVYIKIGFIKSEAGVCQDTGDTIDVDKLREEAFLGFIYTSSITHWDKARFFGGDSVRIGIVYNVDASAWEEKIKAAASGVGSIEERFAIKPIEYKDVESRNTQFFEKLRMQREPYAFVSYSKSILPSSGAIYFSNEFDKVDLKDVISGEYTPSLYERYMGYGNYYFRSGYRFFFLGCCGGGKTGDKYDDLSYSLKEMKSRYQVVAVSNCGEVLDEASENIRFFRDFKFIIGS